jgi:hypothetical protein
MDLSRVLCLYRRAIATGGWVMATMIDTLGYVKRLTAVGVSREQAEAHAEALRDDLAAQVATKIDLESVRIKLDAKIDAVGSEAKSDLRALEGRIDLKFAALEARMLMLNWMSGFTLAAVMAVLWKLLK